MKKQQTKPLPGQLVCLAVDDEQHMVDFFTDLINGHPELYLGLATTDPNEAKAYEQANRVDLAFVDIEMEEMEGLELIQDFSIYTWVVICTAHGNRANDSSRAGAVGFMLKPINVERFNIEVTQIRKRLVAFLGTANGERKYFRVEKRKTGIRDVPLEEIVAFYSANEKVFMVHPDGREEEAGRTLDALSEELKREGFVRTHRSYVINMYFRGRYIRKSEPFIQFGREVRIKLPGCQPNSIPIGRHYRDQVIKLMNGAAR